MPRETWPDIASKPDGYVQEWWNEMWYDRALGGRVSGVFADHYEGDFAGEIGAALWTNLVTGPWRFRDR